MQNKVWKKGANFDPTPSLKRIYTPPSIKVLFHQNKCNPSLRKFMAKSIKTYFTQYNQNMIHNLSDHILNEDEISVFTKALSFVPTPTARNKKIQEIHKAWNNFKTRMLKQYFSRNSIYDKPSPFKKKSNWTPPSSNTILISFFTSVEQELNSISTPHQNIYSNFQLKEKAALNKLRNNHSIIIKPSNKIGGICIMNTREYLHKIHKHFQDCNTYKPPTHNPTTAIANDTSRMHSRTPFAFPTNN